MAYKIEKEFEHKGLKCVVIMTGMGHRCGYVGVDYTHPLYLCSYGEESEILNKKLEELKKSDIGKRSILSVAFWDGETVTPEVLFNVHGGITYSNGGNGSDYPIKSDLWWFGYDCAHAGDGKDIDEIQDEKVREIERMYLLGEVVRSLEYCIEECKSLADQLSEIN